MGAAAVVMTVGLMLGAATPAWAAGGYFGTHASCMAAYKDAQSAGMVHEVYKLCVYGADFPGWYTLHYT